MGGSREIAAVEFPAIRVDVGDPIGAYYQDFSPAVDLVEEGFHGGRDEAGVALARKGGSIVYDAIIVAQYAIALAERLSQQPAAEPVRVELQSQVSAQLDWLLSAQEEAGARRGYWIQRFDNPKYRSLVAPWVSALAQGQGISALLRPGESARRGEYQDAATRAFEAMLLPIDSGGTLWEEGDDLWFEEYPHDPPLHVLNGAIYALFGVLDFHRYSGDGRAARAWEQGLATVARRLSRFDTGYWSRYDARTPELASLHYHRNIHIPQLDALAWLSGWPVFSETAERWRAYSCSRWSSLRRRLEGRLRWKRTAALIGRD